MTQGGWRREAMMKGSGEEGKWWRREVMMTGSGDEGKWWRREVVKKGSGEDGKWLSRGVVTKGSGEEGKWWRREVVRKGSGDEGKWWWRGVVTKGSGEEGEWWRREFLCVSWSCGCRSHWNGCMNVAWSMFWGGSRSTKPCVFPCKVAAAGDERYLVCATGAAAVVLCANCSSYVFCNEWLCLCA